MFTHLFPDIPRMHKYSKKYTVLSTCAGAVSGHRRLLFLSRTGRIFACPAHKNRAFRSNSSELLRNSSGISASIPCAEERFGPIIKNNRILGIFTTNGSGNLESLFVWFVWLVVKFLQRYTDFAIFTN
jgi:hypothetical protein